MIGVLALQGGFELHTKRLAELGAECRPVTTPKDLQNLRGIVLPGGESSVFLKLASQDLREALHLQISNGLPTLATCAGLIFLARGVSNPAQASLNLIDVDVERNAYGRQVDSFIDANLDWTPDGTELLRLRGLETNSLEGVFIRAPRITRLGPTTTALVTKQGEPVMVQEGNVMAASFHPELSDDKRVHALFLSLSHLFSHRAQ